MPRRLDTSTIAAIEFAITAAVKTALLPLTPALDALVNDILKTLGIGLGEAEARVNGVRCDGAARVNQASV